MSIIEEIKLCSEIRAEILSKNLLVCYGPFSLTRPKHCEIPFTCKSRCIRQTKNKLANKLKANQR